MVRLSRMIENGSLTNSEDLTKLVKALDRRIVRIKNKMNEPKAPTTILLDDLNKARIYREEFDALSKML